MPTMSAATLIMYRGRSSISAPPATARVPPAAESERLLSAPVPGRGRGPVVIRPRASARLGASPSRRRPPPRIAGLLPVGWLVGRLPVARRKPQHSDEERPPEGGRGVGGRGHREAPTDPAQRLPH